jgi:hypothetical protein
MYGERNGLRFWSRASVSGGSVSNAEAEKIDDKKGNRGEHNDDADE